MWQSIKLTRVFAVSLIVSALLPALDVSAQSNLIGWWISGPADYTNRASFTPPGTNDGVAVGSGQSWSTTDLPTGATGSSPES